MDDHGTPELRVGVDGAAAVPLTSPVQLAELLRSSRVLELSAEHGRIAARRDGEGWAMEAVRADDEPTRRGRAPNTDAVYDLLRSWGNGDGWWADAFGWVENSL